MFAFPLWGEARPCTAHNNTLKQKFRSSKHGVQESEYIVAYFSRFTLRCIYSLSYEKIAFQIYSTARLFGSGLQLFYVHAELQAESTSPTLKCLEKLMCACTALDLVV